MPHTSMRSRDVFIKQLFVTSQLKRDVCEYSFYPSYLGKRNILNVCSVNVVNQYYNAAGDYERGSLKEFYRLFFIQDVTVCVVYIILNISNENKEKQSIFCVVTYHVMCYMLASSAESISLAILGPHSDICWQNTVLLNFSENLHIIVEILIYLGYREI